MNINTVSPGKGMVALTQEEAKIINGGDLFVITILAIGAAAAALTAVYELGKETGKLIYEVTH